MNKNVFLLLLGMALVPAGCTMAPKYTRRKRRCRRLADRRRLPGSPGGNKCPDVSQLRWQEFFTDPKLQQVIGTALTNNRDLRIAALNVEESRAMYHIQARRVVPHPQCQRWHEPAGAPADLSSIRQP
jgi:multidrug efflux system outer membrane protein